MEIAFIVSLGIIGVTAIVVLSVLVYNQMLMVNEINKRLLLLAKEAQDKERMTMTELEGWIRSSGNIDAVPTAKAPEEEQPFDPFSFQEKEKETDL
jgi:hypothetical protein